MRVVLVGRPADRERLRRALPSGDLEVVGEADTPGAARAGGFPADGYLLAEPSPAGTLAEPLTPRELDVLHVLAEGLPNKAIARRLGISDQTVKFHVAAICGKLGALNRTDAVRLAIQRGLITV